MAHEQDRSLVSVPPSQFAPLTASPAPQHAAAPAVALDTTPTESPSSHLQASTAVSPVPASTAVSPVPASSTDSQEAIAALSQEAMARAGTEAEAMDLTEAIVAASTDTSEAEASTDTSEAEASGDLAREESILSEAMVAPGGEAAQSEVAQGEVALSEESQSKAAQGEVVQGEVAPSTEAQSKAAQGEVAPSVAQPMECVVSGASSSGEKDVVDVSAAGAATKLPTETTKLAAGAAVAADAAAVAADAAADAVAPDVAAGAPEAAKSSLWREIFSKRMGICLVTGFASGMPLFVLINLLSAYLRKEGLDLKVIGAFSLMMVPYTWKFLWAPFVDRYQIFHLGRRKDWIILSQLALIGSIAALGLFSPKENIGTIAFLALIIAFASATQDIVLDAYRREFLPTNELGLGNAVFVNAYRVAGLVPGGISLILADYLPWSVVFIFTAACLVPCLVLSLFLREKELGQRPRTLKEAVVEPFAEFIKRRGVQAALFTVCFVFLYKIGDSMALALATPFYLDLGYDLTTIGIVAKNVGLWSTVAGGLLGGVFMLKLGINRALWVFGLIQLITIMGFYLLAHWGQDGTPSVWLLSLVLVGEYGGGGLGTAAFVAFIAKETNPAYTATQLALLTSFSAVPRTLCNAITGYLVEFFGWENFFILCTVLAIPGMLLLFKVAPWSQHDEAVS